jgi:DNA-binding NarL/FixJ family response regulator
MDIMDKKIRVLLVDDHAILREGLRVLLHLSDDIEVVAEAADGWEALAMVSQGAPNVVVMDMAMPGMGGLEATRRIRDEYPHTRVLVLSQHEDERYVLPVLRAGAAGYVLKRAVSDELVTAIRTVSRGQSFLPPSVAQIVLQDYRQGVEAEAAEDEHGLTPRENEVLKLVVEGYTSKEIAEMLFLSKKTVMCH